MPKENSTKVGRLLRNDTSSGDSDTEGSPPKVQKRESCRRSTRAQSRTPLSPRHNIVLELKETTPVKANDTTPSKKSVMRILDFSNNNVSDPISSPSKFISPLKRLQLKSPVKPSTNFTDVGSPRKAQLQQSPRKAQTPRKAHLEQSPCNAQSPRKAQLQHSPRKAQSPRRPQLHLSPRKCLSPLRLPFSEGACYQKTKQALATGMPDDVVGRDDEMARVNLFLENTLQKKRPGSLYISGPPGTGKTAVVSLTIKKLISQQEKVININCMGLRNPRAFYNRINSELMDKECNQTQKEAVSSLQKSFTSKGEPVVLVLDEIDSLDSKNQEMLYTAFEWPHLSKSRLVLIGIANALDLTDRILPRLKARPDTKPQELHFPSYTKDQIVQVLKSRLASLEMEGYQCLHKSAIELCARKISAVAGDMRKALDICHRAVELVEADFLKSRAHQAVIQSPTKRSKVPQYVFASHIMRVLMEIDSNRSCSGSGSESLPRDQKLALCTLCLMVKGQRLKEVLFGKLHDQYVKVSKQQEVTPLSQSCFLTACSLAETRGLLSLKKGKDTRSYKVRLNVDEKELEQTLQEKGLLASILKTGLIQ